MTRPLALVLAVLAAPALAQIPYTETFGTDARGVEGPCTGTAPTSCSTFDLTGTSWSVSGDFSGLEAGGDRFLTSSGTLEASDTNTRVCWDSPTLTVTEPVVIEVDLVESGDLESADYVDVGYSVDGATHAFAANVSGGGSETVTDDFGSLTVTVRFLSPTTTLGVRVCVLNNVGTETTGIEEVRVAAGTGTDVVINEVRIDGPGGAADEYFELSGTPGASLDGLTFLTIGDLSADGGIVEEVTPLDGLTIPADGTFLAAESAFSLPTTSGVDLTTVLSFEDDDNVTHALVGNFSGASGDDLDADDDGTLDVTPWTLVVDAIGMVKDPGAGDPYYGDVLGFDDAGPSGTDVPAHIYRSGGTDTFMIGSESPGDPLAEDTPGDPNPPTFAQPAFSDAPGYRLLSVPILSATAADLAEVNLVQGTIGQYPAADPSVFPLFTGSGFAPIGSTADPLEPGRGFFMYFFDVAVDPADTAAGGGTSQSRDLAGFAFALAGTPPPMSVEVPFAAPNGDDMTPGLYMVGNAFEAPLDLFGITLKPGVPGTLSRTFQAYDGSLFGGAGGFVALDGSMDDGTAIDVFQGVFASISYLTTPVPGDEPTFVIDVAEVDLGATPPFFWREAVSSAFGLELEGVTASGAPVGDGLADLWFRSGASLGPDETDAGEIVPPSAPHAAIALVQDGGRFAVRGVPASLSGTLDTPVVFRTTEAGTFTLGFDDAAEPPDGLSATLTDLDTGQTIAPGERLAFDAEATDWTERFRLTVSGTSVDREDAPDLGLRVGLVSPNPTAGPARLVVTAGPGARVRVDVVDALGRSVARGDGVEIPAGTTRELPLPGGLAAGVYTVRVTADTAVVTRRMVVVR